MTKDKERDDAMIAEMAEMLRKSRAFIFVHHNKSPLLLEIDALLRGDEPAKLDRYVVAFKDAKDAYIGPNRTEHESDQAAAAVLRRHFPSVEVPREIAQALGWLREVGRFGQPFSITPQIYKAFFMPAIEALTQAAGE